MKGNGPDLIYYVDIIQNTIFLYKELWTFKGKQFTPYSLEDWTQLEKLMFKLISVHMTFSDFFKSYFQNNISKKKKNQ